MRGYLVLKPVRNWIFLVMMTQKTSFRWMRMMRFSRMTEIMTDLFEIWDSNLHPWLNLETFCTWAGDWAGGSKYWSTLGPEKLTHAWSNKTVRRKVGAYCKSQLLRVTPWRINGRNLQIITHELERNMIWTKPNLHDWGCSSRQSSGCVDRGTSVPTLWYWESD